MRLLLVEDTADLAEAIVERLTQDGHAVDWLTDGEQALKILSYQNYSLIILDLGLPKLDGLYVLKRLRAENNKNNKTPVLILTARSGIDDRVQALDIGADDYLIKPIDLRELSARCRAVLRRHHGEAASLVHYGKLQFDRSASRMSIGHEVFELPRRELCILDLLLTHQGRALSKSQLADQLCSFADHDELPSDNAIELYIGRLRKKLTGSGVTIKTLRGIGYLLYVEQ
ncbi:response regulator transcription factor [Thiothrix eikelboomii]|uniref:Two-component system, OmpR family, response regulator TctD n=1 Tax=Thiothrix eikelboomii TaxID=92487 RepID=A0A1T4VTI5_9GAMM|nr:response regulator transcription factor [Thiothrix eikelboomii]SKA68310.1 two-component system, OmpR family, response regulator TctD [Thiothrix eikelboomii]